jgi:hypothetical protein
VERWIRGELELYIKETRERWALPMYEHLHKTRSSVFKIQTLSMNHPPPKGILLPLSDDCEDPLRGD